MLEVRRLSKIFFEQNDPRKPGLVALYNIFLAIRKNEFVSLLGPSGCGKTTLIRIIAGLLTADRGEVLVNSQVVNSPGRDRCMVFQQFGLLPWRTVMSNVEFGLEIDGVPRDERRALAEKYLELVGLKGFENYYPHQISGGMQQRVGIARALSKKPEILLMDEPFGAVDAQTREQLQEELLKIWAQTENTVVFVTHSIDEAIYLSDRVVVMQARPGRIKEEVAIDLPRPRWEGDIKADPRFAQLRAHLRDSLRS
jgi:NitT/TauT family transport system ATP-binding protein